MDVGATIVRIDTALRRAGDPGRAEQEQRYLKSELGHFGTSVPAIRRVVKSVLADEGLCQRRDVIAVAEALWARPVHECRMAAVELLDLRSDVLRASDLRLVERLIRESRTWALLDGLAASVAGRLVDRHPQLSTTLDRWAADGDFWVRRAALLVHLIPLREGRGDFERFARYADAMLDEREFFIRKAIGWVLRDAARATPDRVYAWLLPRAGRASGVTVREAVKYLPKEQEAAVLAAYRARSRTGG
jgi:3-methyladenine DNA glycosylase AlkD